MGEVSASSLQPMSGGQGHGQGWKREGGREPLLKDRLISDKGKGSNMQVLQRYISACSLYFPSNTFIGMEQEKRDTGTELCVNKTMDQVFY